MLYTREPSFWTAENIAKLCKLWDEGKTTTEIGRVLHCMPIRLSHTGT